MNLSLFKYNPKNHNWPLIWRTIAAVMLWTLLLSAVESVLFFEVRWALELSGGVIFGTTTIRQHLATAMQGIASVNL